MIVVVSEKMIAVVRAVERKWVVGVSVEVGGIESGSGYFRERERLRSVRKLSG